jgi:hypothetical protein
LVSTEPCASSTARLTRFSEAISSISSRWRPSSSRIASAISGSVSASEAVNSESATAFAEDSGADIFRISKRGLA